MFNKKFFSLLSKKNHIRHNYDYEARLYNNYFNCFLIKFFHFDILYIIVIHCILNNRS